MVTGAKRSGKLKTKRASVVVNATILNDQKLGPFVAVIGVGM
jgi:hypothetical protein